MQTAVETAPSPPHHRWPGQKVCGPLERLLSNGFRQTKNRHHSTSISFLLPRSGHCAPEPNTASKRPIHNLQPMHISKENSFYYLGKHLEFICQAMTYKSASFWLRKSKLNLLCLFRLEELYFRPVANDLRGWWHRSCRAAMSLQRSPPDPRHPWALAETGSIRLQNSTQRQCARAVFWR